MTDTVKHTPGPWSIENQRVYCDNALGTIVAQCGDFEFVDRSPEETQANMQLITAAPEMLNLLKLLDDEWTSEFKDGPETLLRPGCRIDPKFKKLWIGVRAMIKRAEGETVKQ